jgi:two-component system sensor histidine kinase KdpD
VESRTSTAVARYGAALAAVGVLTFAARSLHTNTTTVGFVFLVAVLLVAAYWGLRCAVLTAVVATASFNFFFLPPVGTFTIADPHNWVALVAFLATALVASNLSERARREAANATRRRQEAERLYAVSQRLLGAEEVPELFAHLPQMLTDAFDASGAVLFIVPDAHYASAPGLKYDEPSLRAAVQAEQRTYAAQQVSVPLQMRGRTVGAVAIVGHALSNETYEALSSLIGLAMERTQAIEELTRNRVTQENERLRSALLDSVSHEFRTPLTGIKASVTSLLTADELDSEQRKELLTIIDEEADRLNRLVAQAGEMAQLDAGDFELDRAPHHVREIVDAAVESARKWLEKRNVEVDIPNTLPCVNVDFERIRAVIAQLLENAGKYSDPGALVRINAEAAGPRVLVRVSDTGIGIDEAEMARVFDKFFRGRNVRYKARGTGMGLAIAKVVVEAHEGTLSVMSRKGIGSVFTVALPVEQRAQALS